MATPPIFDPERCDVPELPKIPREHLITNCSIPDPPSPINQPTASQGASISSLVSELTTVLPPEPPPPPPPPPEEDCNITVVGTTCITGGTAASGGVAGVKGIYFHKSVFRVWLAPSGICPGSYDAMVDMGGGDTDSVLWQGAGGGSPKWSSFPKLGMGIHLGTRGAGWLVISNSGTFAMTAGGSQSWITPGEDGDVGDVLTVQNVSGGCHTLEWKSPMSTSGIDCCFRAYTCYTNTEVQFIVRRGLIVGVEGLDGGSISGATCPPVPDPDPWDPTPDPPEPPDDGQSVPDCGIDPYDPPGPC